MRWPVLYAIQRAFQQPDRFDIHASPDPARLPDEPQEVYIPESALLSDEVVGKVTLDTMSPVDDDEVRRLAEELITAAREAANG